jgi:hypothetical protein
MENIFYIILFLYLLPMIINIIFCYSDKDVYTLEDLLKMWWAYFVPFLNLFMSLMIPIYYTQIYINEWWVKIKNTKIK